MNEYTNSSGKFTVTYLLSTSILTTGEQMILLNTEKVKVK